MVTCWSPELGKHGLMDIALFHFIETLTF